MTYSFEYQKEHFGDAVIHPQRENISSFQNGNIFITTKQTPLTASNEDVEGYDVKAIITIKVRNEEKNLDMYGYCGV